MSRTATLRSLASRTGPVTDDEVRQIIRWLEDDWESHDVDSDAVRLIRRLTHELHAYMLSTRVLQKILRSK